MVIKLTDRAEQLWREHADTLRRDAAILERKGAELTAKEAVERAEDIENIMAGLPPKLRRRIAE